MMQGEGPADAVDQDEVEEGYEGRRDDVRDLVLGIRHTPAHTRNEHDATFRAHMTLIRASSTHTSASSTHAAFSNTHPHKHSLGAPRNVSG